MSELVTPGTRNELSQPVGESMRLVTDELVKAGTEVVCTLPDTWLAPLITVIDASDDLVHVKVTREESAIAVCFGAFLGGKSAVAVMGTSGFIASVYAITKLCMTYEVGVTLITNLRGGIGDPAGHHVMNGVLAQRLLDTLGIPVAKVESANDVALVGDAIRHAALLGRPVAVSLPKAFGGS